MSNKHLHRMKKWMKRKVIAQFKRLGFQTNNPLFKILERLIDMSDILFTCDTGVARVVYDPIKNTYTLELNPSLEGLIGTEDLLYIFLHEALHIYLNHFSNHALKELEEISPSLANVVADIEVNAFIDCYTDIVPDFVLSFFGIQEMRNKSIQREKLFFMYLISGKEILKNFGSLEGFFEYLNLPNISKKDIEHWITFKKKLMAGEVRIDEIVREMEYWFHPLEIWYKSITIPDFTYDLEELEKITPGTGGNIVQRKVKYVNSEDVWEVAEKLLSLISRDPESRCMRPDFKVKRSVVPSVFPGRREIFLIRMGKSPVFYSRDIYGIYSTQGVVHLYVDVSGSFHDYLPYIFGIVYHLRSLIGKPIYQFSTVVEPLQWENVYRGNIKTTLGTDFNCVLKHSLKHKFRKIIVFTDGEFYYPEKKVLNAFKESGGEVHFIIPQEKRRKDEEGLWFDTRKALAKMSITKSITTLKLRRTV